MNEHLYRLLALYAKEDLAFQEYSENGPKEFQLGPGIVCMRVCKVCVSREIFGSAPFTMSIMSCRLVLHALYIYLVSLSMAPSYPLPASP